ncbi:MAG: glycosyltransferase [Verrucomicrobiaceae bacterium]|nr:MAG: glycosyltransferase [Verrucomicrobiaceae bacterium]
MSTSFQPIVSVIMPCFNHGRFLAESVKAVLNQTEEAIELIVVDDHSSDDSNERLKALACEDPRMIVVRHERNRGASSSRNDGLRLARGEFVAFCDADDVWEPEKVAAQLALLTDHPEYDLTYSDAVIIDEHGRADGQRFSDIFTPPRQPSGKLFNDLYLRNFINMQTVMVRRACMAGRLLFDERIRWVEDWWLWIQLSRQSAFLYSPQPLAKYRTHSCSTVITHLRGYHLNRFKVLKRILRVCPELSPSQRTQIWHQMGCALRHAGKPRLAQRFYRQACEVGVHNWEVMVQCARPFARMLWPGR